MKNENEQTSTRAQEHKSKQAHDLHCFEDQINRNN